uniref:Repeat domain-containing protein n=1 Tax=Candidatus Kentrum sp. TUN TaxID=2126343 RepID=A0A450ZKH1_9GAMM|nr:MAG: Repeat domain-containing protein [Candidatus Kentron sp. TUN]
MRSIGWIFALLVLFSLPGCENPLDGHQAKGNRSSILQTPITQALDTQAIRANNRAVGLMGQFEYDAAADVFADLVAQHPDWSDAKLNLAIAILNRQRDGDEKAALALADEVLIADPEHLRAHYIAGILRLYLSSPQDAMRHFASVVAGDPGDVYAAYYLGQCFAQQSEPEKALAEYRRALKLDPYLRSAAYGAFQALQQLRRREEARDFITQYQRLATNPRARLAEFKYTRMGPKAEALVVGVATKEQYMARPQGPVFAKPAPILADADFSLHLSKYLAEQLGKDAVPISITVMDLESDGHPDLFVAGLSAGGDEQHNLLLTGTREGGFVLAHDNPLTRVSDVNGALWGDFDNDGRPDVYLFRRGPNQLWRNGEGGVWIDVTTSTGTGNDALNTVDGTFFDADHDGDLDLFLVNEDGPNALLHNNLDGTFRTNALGGSMQADSNRDQASLTVIPSDLDRDRDADIIVLNRKSPHQVYINDRLWAYHASKNFQVFQSTPALSATVGDADADGWPEIYTLTPAGVLIRWSRRGQDDFVPERLSCVQAKDSEFSCLGIHQNVDGSEKPTIPVDSPWAQMAMLDVDGDGVLELLVATQVGWSIIRVVERPGGAGPVGEPIFTAFPEGKRLQGITPMLQAPGSGHGLVGLWVGADGDIDLLHWSPGPGRHRFLALAFSGMEDVGKSMRSNASGIGTRMAVRVGARWTIAENFRDHSGPGQNLQPVSVGLGGAPRLDFVAIDWSDGVFQSELDLDVGRLHRVTETQRQLSSCPVLFAWDGKKYRFVTDFLGVGGIGYAVGPPGEYGNPRPWENLLLSPENVLPKQGRYVFKLTEPMEESAYMDALGMKVYDLPPGWRMVLDERMNIAGEEPTGTAIFYRHEITPEKAINERGEIVTASVIDADGRVAPIGVPDRRFIGRLAQEHILTLTFSEEIYRKERQSKSGNTLLSSHAHRQRAETSVNWSNSHADAPVLVIDGWVEYPYSQTMFAAWQASAAWEAPTVEVLGSDGKWHTILSQFGYPAGMPRRMSVPLRGLPPGASMLRLRTNQEIYWDRIAVAFPEPLPEMRKHTLSLEMARLAAVGFPERTDDSQRRPRFDYNRRRPFEDMRSMAGFYTEYGPVDELLSEIDDAIAIFGAGEEIHVEFTAPPESPPPGWRRYMVLETHGWTKDRDLYTKDGETVGPLPGKGRPSKRREVLHARYNTRYVEGAGYYSHR